MTILVDAALGTFDQPHVFVSLCLIFFFLFLPLTPGILRVMICDMPEIKGTNPSTGADSKDSIMCTDINQG